MQSRKPYSAACDQNQAFILEVLQQYFKGRTRVLEIGSGTGQHACHFAQAMPELQWQCSDVGTQLPGIRAWLRDAGLGNTPEPVRLDVNGAWPHETYDAAFTANCFHIMDEPSIVACFTGLGQVLSVCARFIVYGPFNYDGAYTSGSNARFDQWLKDRDPSQGIRDFETVNALARRQNMTLVKDLPMPANNRCLIWDKHA